MSGETTPGQVTFEETTSGVASFGVTLRIPNKEVKYIYENQIRKWTGEQIEEKDRSKLHQAMLCGDSEALRIELNQLLRNSISYMDSPEAFYHGFMTGVLSGMFGQDYRVLSNRESGDGRADLYLLPPQSGMTGAVIELKAARRLDEMDRLCEDALKQIEEKNYAEELRQYGCKEIYYYGIAFFRKECRVQCVKEI